MDFSFCVDIHVPLQISDDFSKMWPPFKNTIFTGLLYQSCERMMDEKTLLSHKLCGFRCLISRPQNLKINSEVSKSQSVLVKNYFFLKNYVTSEGAVSHNILYYQQVSIARNQVSFYANNYWTTNWAQNFHNVFCMHEMYHVRRLVFDNYQ